MKSGNKITSQNTKLVKLVILNTNPYSFSKIPYKINFHNDAMGAERLWRSVTGPIPT